MTNVQENAIKHQIEMMCLLFELYEAHRNTDTTHTPDEFNEAIAYVVKTKKACELALDLVEIEKAEKQAEAKTDGKPAEPEKPKRSSRSKKKKEEPAQEPEPVQEPAESDFDDIM